MSWQIPTQIEQDIIAGKAKYQTFQTGNGGQSILPVPPNSYAVIFGYDFSPAGGGFKRLTTVASVTTGIAANDTIIRKFETQQIAFYTSTDFFPFIHHVDVKTTIAPKTIDTTDPAANRVSDYQICEEIDNTTLARQVYITSTNDVTVTVGLIDVSLRTVANAIPVTNRTPIALTYGGSGQVVSTQSNYGPAGTPLQFMQPSPKDFQDFGFGLLPGNADGQAFATPDVAFGLQDPSDLLSTIGAGVADRASAQYYLNLHYALYSAPIPEQRG